MTKGEDCDDSDPTIFVLNSCSECTDDSNTIFKTYIDLDGDGYHSHEIEFPSSSFYSFDRVSKIDIPIGSTTTNFSSINNLCINNGVVIDLEIIDEYGILPDDINNLEITPLETSEIEQVFVNQLYVRSFPNTGRRFYTSNLLRVEEDLWHVLETFEHLNEIDHYALVNSESRVYINGYITLPNGVKMYLTNVIDCQSYDWAEQCPIACDNKGGQKYYYTNGCKDDIFNIDTYAVFTDHSLFLII